MPTLQSWGLQWTLRIGYTVPLPIFPSVTPLPYIRGGTQYLICTFNLHSSSVKQVLFLCCVYR